MLEKLDIYKQKLEEDLRSITEELEALGVPNPGTEADWIPTLKEPSDAEPDPNNLGDRSEDWQENRGTLDLLETRLNNVKRALQKIADGNYGLCEICQNPIEEDRLSIHPSARTCKQHMVEEDKLPLV